MRRAKNAWTCLLGLPLLHCSGAVPLVARGPHPLQGGATPFVVDEAPPPAEVEEIASATPPRADCAWADGRYVWQDNRWIWEPGGWVKPTDECYYAEPMLVWAPGVDHGVLFYTPGQWYRRSSGTSCPAPPAC